VLLVVTNEPSKTALRLTVPIALLATLVAIATTIPLLVTSGPGPTTHVSVRGEPVVLHGIGPYQHMPADVAVQGLAQDVVTLGLAVPLLLVALVLARRGSRAAYLFVTGAIAYVTVQYALYLGLAMYNELFLLWVAILLLASQLLVRLLLAEAPAAFAVTTTPRRRHYVGGYLIATGSLIAMLWLSVIVPPLIEGTIYPAGLAHFTTMFVQAFDLALFIPPALIAGLAYWRGRPHGDLLAPVYAVFLSLQMPALLAKVAWMSAIGASAGPALVLIPILLVGAVTAAALALGPHLRVAPEMRADRSRWLLAGLLLFIALNAFAGGYYGMTGAPNVPTEWLAGSPFDNYFVPSVILFVVVGGAFLAAAIAVVSRVAWRRIAVAVAVAIAIGWLVAQVAIIGYVSWMQPATAIATIVVAWLATRLPPPSERRVVRA
jgi:hypothetical protein